VRAAKEDAANGFRGSSLIRHELTDVEKVFGNRTSGNMQSIIAADPERDRGRDTPADIRQAARERLR
jgi:hypothetical protein